MATWEVCVCWSQVIGDSAGSSLLACLHIGGAAQALKACNLVPKCKQNKSNWSPKRPLKYFLYWLVVGEEAKHVGPCGTCGAIRVGAVSALFAPNAKKRWWVCWGVGIELLWWDGWGLVAVVCLWEKWRKNESSKQNRQWGEFERRQSCSWWSECEL